MRFERFQLSVSPVHHVQCGAAMYGTQTHINYPACMSYPACVFAKKGSLCYVGVYPGHFRIVKHAVNRHS